jgi:CheY-like chemotaxis protein
VHVLAQRRAIIILDEPDVANTLTHLLTPWVGDTHRVLTASGSEEILQHVSERSVDLVISEYAFPIALGSKVRDGIGLARWVKQVDPDVRVILLTSNDHATIDFDAAERWVDMYLHKPFFLRELQDAVLAGLVR